MVGKAKPTSTVLIVERGRTRERSDNGKAKGGSKGQSKSRGRFQHDKKDMECWKCGKTNHMKKDCRDKAKASEVSTSHAKASTSQANVAVNQTEADLLNDADKFHAL
ncbi:hypothetical protein R1flu_014103 [Riccia fluitans]|uniref:CCHC-type domain-containing protein n=1 Tax=Riccia fluitans TaxID=41844 RepID=A0ABD1YFA0_9MARC